MIKELLSQNPLFVFALESEALNKFDDLRTLFVGVGKVNAAYHLTKNITINRPSIIVNLGSAGSNAFGRGSIICCTQFIQRDMDASMLGCELFETPFSGTEPVLSYGLEVENLPKGICGTGDSFEMEHKTDAYNVVEMEAYPLAYIAQHENIPFLCLKYISDGADDSAAQEWEKTVRDAAQALRKVIDSIVNSFFIRFMFISDVENIYRNKFKIVHDNLFKGNSFLTNLTIKTSIETDLSLHKILSLVIRLIRCYPQGLYREFLKPLQLELLKKQSIIKEREICIEDLNKYAGLFLINSMIDIEDSIYINIFDLIY